MTELEFLSRHVFFTTRTYAFFLNKSISVATRKLKHRTRVGEMIQVTRGVWGNKYHHDFTPYGVIPYLLGNEEGYLSFLSAMHRHDMISQIPSSIQVATTGRARILKSPIGEFHFFQIKPELMSERAGIQVFNGPVTYNIASPEKALLDTFYLSTKKGRRFKKLPEIELHSSSFNKKKFLKWLNFYPIVAQRQIWERYQQLP